MRLRDVRKAARAASTYFRQHTAAWRTNPALVALGTMDEEGEHAVLSAQELLALAKQGRGGLIQSMLPLMLLQSFRKHVYFV